MNSLLRYLLLLLLINSCTKPPLPPVARKILIVTNVATNITSSSAICSGEVEGDQYSDISDKGVCWNISTSPTTSNSFLSSGPGPGSISKSLTGLLPNKKYYVRAYITNYAGVIYGNEISFVTAGTLSTLTTTSVSSITQTTATSGGSQINAGGLTITAKGVCWSTSSNPTILNNKTSNGTGTTAFTSNISGLTAGTTYYVRSYATNALGTAYGQEVQFSTAAIIPVVTTSAISVISGTSASGGGNVLSDGGSPVLQRGVCWSSTSTLPTIAGFRTIDGAGTGIFTSNLSGLLPNTTYYVRSFATNIAGTAYGQQVQFTTSSTLPTLTTSTATSLSATAATSGGNILSDGGSFVSQRGVCWSSTTTAPTVAGGAVTFNGSGTGTFISTLSGLIPNTTYYLRAYASNSLGTSYGNLTSFTTGGIGVPTLVSPFNGSSRPCCTINFSWNAVSGATGYEIQVSRSNIFSGTLFTLNPCTGSNYPSTTGTSRGTTSGNTFCMSAGNSTYVGIWYWRVRGSASGAFGPWSSTFYYNYTY